MKPKEGAKLIHSLRRSPIDGEAERFLGKLLQLANQENVPSDTFILAVSDAVAITAASIDLNLAPQDLDKRLAVMNERIRDKYLQVLAVMERRKWNPYQQGAGS